MLSALHQRVASVLAELPRVDGFALAGGGALIVRALWNAKRTTSTSSSTRLMLSIGAAVAGIMAGVARNWHLERYPGKYVAIDMRTDEVVLVADTPQELDDEIQSRGLRHVASMRAPRADEPLFVGPG